MGGYLLLNIEFPNKKDRLLLENYDKYFLSYGVLKQTTEIIEMIERELPNSLGKKKILAILNGEKQK